MSNSKPLQPDEKQMETYARMFKALSNPNRLRIMVELSRCSEPGGLLSTRADEVENCQQDFAEHLGLAPSTVSHHFKELRLAGLLTIKREGKTVFVRVNTAALEAVKKLF